MSGVKKKIIDNNLRSLIISKKISTPASSFINAKGDLVQTKYDNYNLDTERSIIEASPVGQKIREDYANRINKIIEDNESYRHKKSKPNKIKRCRCKK